MGVIKWGDRDYDGGSYTVYPTGTYRVKVLDVEETTANTGTPQLKFSCEIVEPSEYAGKKYTEFIPTLDSVLWKVMQLVYGCGIDVDKLPDMDSTSPVFRKVVNACKGKEAWFYIEKSQYNGKDKNGVANFQRIEGNDLVEIDVESEDVPDWCKE